MNYQLTNSKTLWGFGIAIGLLIARRLLEQYAGIIISETDWDAIIYTASLIAGWFGIYGIRDAIRKETIINNLKSKEEVKN